MTNINIPEKIISLQAIAPGAIPTCTSTEPLDQPAATPSIPLPVAPGITYELLPEPLTVIDSSPDAMIGCVYDTFFDAQTILNEFFPSAILGDGVIERKNNNIWVYDGVTWNNVGENPGPTIVATALVPVWNESVKITGLTKTIVNIASYPYTLFASGGSHVLKTKTKINARIATRILVDTFDTIEQSALTPSKIGEAERIPGPTLQAIIYSQSSVYEPNTAANAVNMQDGTVVGTATGTDYYLNEISWIQMDLGAIYVIDRLIIGTATTALPGGWDKSYTENLDIEYSNDNLNWTTFGTTGTFPGEGIYQLEVNFTCRYIKLSRLSAFVGLTELYALSPRQESPIDFGRRIYATTSSAQIAAENPIIVANAIFVDITSSVALEPLVPEISSGYSLKPSNVIVSITANSLITVGYRAHIEMPVHVVTVETGIPSISTGAIVAVPTGLLQITSSDEVGIGSIPRIETQVAIILIAAPLPTVSTGALVASPSGSAAIAAMMPAVGISAAVSMLAVNLIIERIPPSISAVPGLDDRWADWAQQNYALDSDIYPDWWAN